MTSSVSITRFESSQALPPRPDDVAIEEPLEIRIEGRSIAVVMRTPGQDRELAAGWLLSEGVIRAVEDLHDIVLPPGGDAARINTVDVMLKNAAGFEAERFSRHVVTSSSCGVCGAVSLEAATRDLPKLTGNLRIPASLLTELPARLASQQPAFQRSGGIHACALFDASGTLLAVREDVGRHNALDKLIGWALFEKRLPLHENILLLSGRVSFEMMQKALAAGIPIVTAIGAPSSLAVALAERSGQTLAAFLRGATFNVYSGVERVAGVSK